MHAIRLLDEFWFEVERSRKDLLNIIGGHVTRH